MSELFSSYLDLLLFQPAVMFTVNQYKGHQYTEQASLHDL
jgi:hypothetical protein